MYRWRTSDTPGLDREIARATAELNAHPVLSDKYAEVMERLSRLKKMQEAEKPARQISPDTLVLAATNLLGIAMIIRHEHMNVITSKAMGHLIKTR